MSLLRATSLRIAPQRGEEQTPMRGPIDMELDEGQVVQIAGRSGSGKSTLLRCLARLEARAEGAIFFRETLVAGSAVPAFRRQAVYVPQTPPGFPCSVAESLRLAFRFRSAKEHFPEERARAMCDELLLPKEILNRDLPRVSGGEAQRLAIARALLLDPVILLLDEPTSALDEDAEEAVHALVQAWFAKGGRSLIFISHKRALLSEHTSSRRIMRDGLLGAPQ